ncbi:MAG: Eco57I restriction-modification methylase domain-containing protein [Candidatus Methanomethylophilaceae archaeon]|nr:Eco57I restriction-modification methylase domain-containing protein [Candidatus Methanomethylophilaceae archaeon]
MIDESFPMIDNPRDPGVVYTRSWVVDLMLDIIGYTSDRPLYRSSILEPSCGEGAFLTAIVRRLCSSKGFSECSVEDLSDCICAVDLVPDSIEKCRADIIEILISYGMSESDSDHLAGQWLRAEDYLLKSYSDFDFVVGNPPYVSSDEIPKNLREDYCSRLSTVTMGTDLYVGFIENSLLSLGKDGKVCFICSDRWMQNSYGSKLRGFVSDGYHLDLICRMHDVDAFESEVSAYPAIIVLDRNESTECRYVVCDGKFSNNDAHSLKSALIGMDHDNKHFQMSSISIHGSRPWPLSSLENLRLVDYMRLGFPSIEDTGVKIGIGVATGKDDVYIITDPDLIDPDRLLPLIKKEDIVEGNVPESPVHWLVNPWNADGTLIDLAQYPLTGSYLNDHKESLAKRHVAKKNQSMWYRTIDKVHDGLMSRPKLLLQDMSSLPDPYYDDGRYYPSHNMYWMTSDNWSLKVLGGILLSDQVARFIDAVGVKMRGNTMRCQAQYLRMLHIPTYESIEPSQKDALANAFENRDRALATSIMQEILFGGKDYERRYEEGPVEVL